MKTNVVHTILLALIAALLLINLFVGKPSRGTKWEYKHHSASPQDIESDVVSGLTILRFPQHLANAHGRDGWEMVGFSWDEEEGAEFVYKRPIGFSGGLEDYEYFAAEGRDRE